jgi:hypothetical protein
MAKNNVQPLFILVEVKAAPTCLVCGGCDSRFSHLIVQ